MARRGGPKQVGDVSFERLHLWQVQAVRDLLLVALVAGLVWLGHAMRAVTVPLLVALLLAYLFEPMVARLSQRPRLSRHMVVGGLLVTVGVLLVGVLAVVIPVVVTQTTDLVDKFQNGQVRRTAMTISSHFPEQLRTQAEELIDHLPAGPGAAPGVQATPAEGQEPAVPAEVVRDVAGPDTVPADQEAVIRSIVRDEISRTAIDTVEEPRRWLGVAKGGATAAGKLLVGIVKLGFVAFLIPFYFFFFSIWYPSVIRFGRNLIPESNRPHTLELLQKMDNVVAGFVRGRIVISLIMGVMLAAGWKIIGVPYSIVLGLVVGLFCAVPYLGGVGVPIAVGLLAVRELSQPEGMAMVWWGIILWPTLWFAIVQFIEGYALTPMIAGKATNLDPVTILVAVLAGGSIMGIYGMLLGIPVAACIKVLFSDVVLPKIHAWTSGEAADPLPIKRN